MSAAEVEPLRGLRKTIAQRMAEAWQAPTFRVTTSVNVQRADERRRSLERATLTDEIIRCSGRALSSHPDLNAALIDDAIHRFASVNVGLAVAIDDGLIVPVIRDADQLGLGGIARARADIVTRARSRQLTSADVSGGTFTVSNLGMYGVDRFDALLNVPQVAILAVGAALPRVVMAEGRPVERRFVELTLTVDHRAVDGAQAAAFMRTLKEHLEADGG
jgi:pyruvate dehydrogenase E2 component (dihydrolipoamide acetyltransferase)